MIKALTFGGLLAISALASNAAAQGFQANTLDELRSLFAACARLRSTSQSWADSHVTVRFSVRRDGHLLGQPRITYSKLPASPEDQRAFMAASLSALADCFPLPITPGLGGAIAGRPITLRISGRAGRGDILMPQI